MRDTRIRMFVTVLVAAAIASSCDEGGSGSGGGGTVVVPVPANLRATGATASQVVLAWDAVSGAAGYDVYRDDATLVQVVPPTHTDAGLATTDVHAYKVRAFDADGNVSAFSAAVTVARVDAAADLQTKTDALQPGDTLLVLPGTYDISYWDLRDLAGTATDPIAIRAAGSVLIRTSSSGSNAVELSETHHLTLAGFEITLSGVPAAIDGIKLSGTECSHVTMEDLHIHDVTNNGITIMAAEAHDIVLRNSEIANCDTCGIYWGYPASSVVHDVTIENNYIHHCPTSAASATGYGIQYKGWSYRARIEDNVLHDVGGTTRSGIIVYYGKTPLQGDVAADMNVVRGNVLWNCRNEGITAMSDALVENNVVFDAVWGINLQTYNDVSFTGDNFVEHLVARYNTVYRCSSACLALSGWTSLGANVVVMGNALYQPQATDVAATGSKDIASVYGNIHWGTSSLGDGSNPGAGLGDFVSVGAASVVPDLDFYPASGSAVVDAVTGATFVDADDFNGTSRLGMTPDAGAYEWTMLVNPGWTIQQGFKQ